MNPGELVDRRFRLEAEAGAGAMGLVFRARDERSGETVALKVVRAPGAKRIARFAREAEVLARLDAPEVVRYVAHGETKSGEPYLVMEWLEGETLSARLRREALTLEQTLKVGRSLAAGLAAAHRAGVVHRDVKPSNILLVGASVDDVRLIDFGIARAEAVGATLTATGAALGSFAYMAPEQAFGAHDASPAADVYALGCVLFRCLAGRPLVQANRPADLIAKVLSKSRPRASEVNASVPPELDALVVAMTASEAVDRPKDGAAALAALAAIRAGREAASRPAGEDRGALSEEALHCWVRVHCDRRPPTEDLSAPRRAGAVEARSDSGDATLFLPKPTEDLPAVTRWGLGLLRRGEVGAVHVGLAWGSRRLSPEAASSMLAHDGAFLPLETSADAEAGRAQVHERDRRSLEALRLRALDDERPALALLCGPPGVGRHELARRLAFDAGDSVERLGPARWLEPEDVAARLRLSSGRLLLVIGGVRPEPAFRDLADLVVQLRPGRLGPKAENERDVAAFAELLTTLTPASNRLARAAALLESVEHALLEALVDDEDIGEARDALLASRLLTRRGAGYTFDRPAAREAARRASTLGDRRIGHRLAAEHLELADEPDEAAIAMHFDEAGLPRRALPWRSRQAHRCLTAGDAVGAMAIADRALTAELPQAGRGDLLGVVAAAHLARGEGPLAVEAATEALELLVRGTLRYYEVASTAITAHLAIGGGAAARRIQARLRFDAPAMDALDAHAACMAFTIG